MQTYLKTKPSIVQLLIFMGIALVLFGILYIAGAAVITSVTGVGIAELVNMDNWNLAEPKYLRFIRGMLLLQFIGLFVAPSLLFAFLSDRKPLDYLGLKRPVKPAYWILGLAGLIIAYPLVEYLGLLNRQISFGADTDRWIHSMEETAMKQIQMMLQVRTPTELILNLIFIALFAGVGEELFFRGVLQRLFIRAFRSPWAGIIFTALLFSAFHMQFLGFFPRFLLGILLGAVYWFSGSLWPAILAHFVYDALIIILVYQQPQLLSDPDMSMIDKSNMAVMALGSALVTGLVLWRMMRLSTVTYADVYKDDRPDPNTMPF
ncbi:MAG TPA: type II CAAX endopeptidase family protein [Chitinophagaceae bacterium]|jgi:hypothetical protein|nr:type II CAAX endopeptidase family protein [Chitinophagaceae bacterium]